MLHFNVKKLSQVYEVRKLKEEDIPKILALCEGNPMYYDHCPPPVSADSIKKDMEALPPNKTIEDKYYIGFWEKDKLTAVLDLHTGYPDEETAFIGFFMMNREQQGQGIGSKIIEDVCQALNEKFSRVRLGYVAGNEQAWHFWHKNGFEKTGIESEQEKYTVVMLEKQLQGRE